MASQEEKTHTTDQAPEEEEDVSIQIEKGIKALDLETKIKAVALNHYLDKKKELDEELEKEMKALTLKYEKLSEPLYQKQSEIISGDRAPVDEELVKVDEFLTEEEKQNKASSTTAKAIQGYWVKAMKNCDMVAPEIKEKDEAILKYVKSINYKYQEDSENFEIIITFDENEHFTNTELKKIFIMKDEEEPLKGEGTEINWNTGKNITKKQVKKTQKNKKSGAKRVITKEVEDDSFFNFFKTVSIDEDNQDADEDQFKVEEQLNIQYDIGRALIDEVIPYSLEYFLGVKTSDQEPQEDEDFEDMNDNEDEEDDESAEKAPKKKSKKQKGKKDQSHKSSENSEPKEKPECKQQ